MLRCTEREVILNCSRQSGKSTTTATLAVWTACYQPNSLILLLSPGDRQSAELFKKCTTVYHAALEPAPLHSETARSLQFANGSRIVSLPGKDGTVRGFSGARLIVIDEAAWVLDPLYYAIRPMLAVSGGRLVLMSTPFGKRGFFHDAWDNGGPGWRRFKIPATQCPRISPEFLANERKRMPAYQYEQEYLCVFGEAEGALWPEAIVDQAFDVEQGPLWE